MIGDAPDAPVPIVRYIKCAVGSHRQSRWPVRGLAGLLNRTGKSIGENHKWPRGFAVFERLEHNVVAALRVRGSIPGHGRRQKRRPDRQRERHCRNRSTGRSAPNALERKRPELSCSHSHRPSCRRRHIPAPAPAYFECHRSSIPASHNRCLFPIAQFPPRGAARSDRRYRGSASSVRAGRGRAWWRTGAQRHQTQNPRVTQPSRIAFLRREMLILFVGIVQPGAGTGL